MSSFSFRYIEERGIWRPKIPLLFNAKGIETELVGLIDSGSDFIIIPKDIADALGIELSKKTEDADGVGGPIKLKTGRVNIVLFKKGLMKRVMRNIEVRVPVNEKCGFDDILLGRKPFFEYFKTIEFDENLKRVKLVPNRKSP